MVAECQGLVTNTTCATLVVPPLPKTELIQYKGKLAVHKIAKLCLTHLSLYLIYYSYSCPSRYCSTHWEVFNTIGIVVSPKSSGEG